MVFLHICKTEGRNFTMQRQKKISFWDVFTDMYFYPDDIVLRRPNSGLYGRSQDAIRIKSYFETTVSSLNVAAIAKQAKGQTKIAR